MKKIVITFLLAICAICALIAYEAYHYYAPPQQREPYSLSDDDDTLRIAYIGDSWAFMHQEHDCQIGKLLEDTLHRPVKIHSYGICGLTSKEIYENLFMNSDMKNFMKKRHYDFCFISAGINDTYKKMSTDYYKTSMNYIIQFMLTNNTRPIILEIPDYDIMKAYDLQRTERKLLRKISMIINGTQMDCKQDFRNALHDLISEKKYHHLVDVIDYKEWNNNMQDDLRQFYNSDGLHLNQKGYMKLDSVIAKHIANN